MAADLVWKGKASLFTGDVNTVLVEDADSPQYNFGEKITCTRKYSGLHSLCLASALYKGISGIPANLPPAYGGLDMTGWYVAKSTVNKRDKQIGHLIVEWEGPSYGFGSYPETTKPDTWSLTPTDINPRIELHTRYAAFTKEERAAIRAWVDAPNEEDRDEALASLPAVVNSARLSMAYELGEKILSGQDSYYIAGWTYTWTSYYWAIPAVSDGGRIETPTGPMAGLLGTGLVWLRKADEADFDGTIYKLTRTWLGADKWDTDLYPSA
jgi:hypothetical protein